MFRSLLAGTTTFIFIFGWKINSVADLILIVSLLLIFLGFWRGTLLTHRLINQTIAVLGLLCIYTLAICLINGIFDTQIALRSLRALLNLLGGICLVNLYHAWNPQAYAERLYRDIYLSLVTHAALMIGMYLNHNLREAVYEITDAAAYVNLSSPFLEGYRIAGLTYGLSQTSVLQMLGLLLAPLVIRNAAGNVARLIYLAGVPLLLISIMICGRSGLLLALLLSPVVLAALFKSAVVGSPTRSLINFAGIAAAITVSTGLLLTMISFFPGQFSYSLHQAGEIFLALELKGPGVEVLAPMFFLPDSWPEFVFGSSNLGRGNLEYIPSDIGWVKTIFATGLTGTVLMLVPFIIGMRAALLAARTDLYMGVAGFCVFLSALLLNTKELALLTRNQWSVQVLILALLCFKIAEPANKTVEAAHAG
jgi:hypothetical protein